MSLFLTHCPANVLLEIILLQKDWAEQLCHIGHLTILCLCITSIFIYCFIYCFVLSQAGETVDALVEELHHLKDQVDFLDPISCDVQTIDSQIKENLVSTVLHHIAVSCSS